MAHYFYARGNSGELIIPVANGVYYTDRMSGDYTEGQVYVEFFSDSLGMTPATATAGTIFVEASPIGGTYIAASENALLNAAAISAGTYTPSKFEGSAVRGRVTLSGVTGPAYAKIMFWRA